LSEVVRVELFGGVRVVTAAGEASAPSMRAGALLAALVIARGARVGLAELTGLLWPSGEPATAANQLHRLVGQVRRLFEPDLPPRAVGAFVVGSSAGYRLNTSLVHSDVDDCDAAVKRARGLVELQDWEEASEQYAAALAILQHPLLGDATWEATSHSGFSVTTRKRIAVASESLACARRGGRIQDVIALVERIASAVPFEEGLQADLVTALAQAGRRGDAMLLYERVRSALVHELGVDPGPSCGQRTSSC
jgi:DNA-binding SARP family transcriptional activator